MDIDYMEKKYPREVKAAKDSIDARFRFGAMAGIKYPEKRNAYIGHDFTVYRTCYSPKVILWRGDDVEIINAEPLELAEGLLYKIVEAGTGVDPAGLHEWSYCWHIKKRTGVNTRPLWRTYPTNWEHYAPGYISKSLRESGLSVSVWLKAEENGIIPIEIILTAMKWDKEKTPPVTRVKTY